MKPYLHLPNWSQRLAGLKGYAGRFEVLEVRIESDVHSMLGLNRNLRAMGR